MEVARTHLAHYDELPNLQDRPERRRHGRQEPPELPAEGMREGAAHARAVLEVASHGPLMT